MHIVVKLFHQDLEALICHIKSLLLLMSIGTIFIYAFTVTPNAFKFHAAFVTFDLGHSLAPHVRLHPGSSSNMDWKVVLSSGSEEVEKNEELLERLYEFFLKTDLPQEGEKPRQRVYEKAHNLPISPLL